MAKTRKHPSASHHDDGDDDDGKIARKKVEQWEDRGTFIVKGMVVLFSILATIATLIYTVIRIFAEFRELFIK